MAAPSSQPKSLVMILARELASNVATPIFVVDPAGTLVYYNEPAEVLLGQSFHEAGELGPDQWGTMFAPRTRDGVTIPVEKQPLSVALAERRPSHSPMTITGVDGMSHEISVTAFPLLGTSDSLVGAIAVFWEAAGD